MRYVRQAGSDPSFLLKALGESSGDLRRSIDGLSRIELLRTGEGFDEDWCLLAIAVHLRDTEEGILEQVEAILSGREPEIRHVDLDDIPLPDVYRDADEDRVLDEFQFYRRHTTYTLWDLPERHWERAGLHPYRGKLTIMEIAREAYQHDLEHLWQARRMLDAMTRPGR